MSKTVRLLNVGEIQNSSGYVKQMVHPNHAEGVAPSASRAMYTGRYAKLWTSINSGSWSYWTDHGNSDDARQYLNPIADKDGNVYLVGGRSRRVQKVNGSDNSVSEIGTTGNYDTAVGMGAVDVCSNGELGVLHGGKDFWQTGNWMNETGGYLWNFSSNSYSLGPIFSQTGGIGYSRAMHSNGDHCFRMNWGHNGGSVVNWGKAMDKANFARENSSSWGMLPATNGLGQAAGNELDIYHMKYGEEFFKSSMTQNASTVQTVAYPNFIAKWNGKTAWGSIVSDGDQLVCKTLTQSGSNGYFNRFNVSMTDGSLITGWNENGPWAGNSSITEMLCACAYNS